MSTLLVRPHQPDPDGCVLEVTPRSAGWTQVGFKVCHLAPGREMAGGEAERETCIVVLSGSARITVADVVFESVGTRASVFDDAAPGAVYVPAGMRYSVAALTSRAELAFCTAPGRPGRA